MVGDCLRTTRETVRLYQNQLKSCFGGSFCLCCFCVASAVKNGMINGVRKRGLTIPFEVKGGRCGGMSVFSRAAEKNVRQRKTPRACARRGYSLTRSNPATKSAPCI